jgi:hypothetical protein
MPPQLRASSKVQAGGAIQDFFAKSKVPRSSDRFLQTYVNEISRPYDWDTYLRRWRGEDDDDKEDEDNDEGNDGSFPESGQSSTSSVASLNTKPVMKKRYVTHGIYFIGNRNKKSAASSAFPLPVHSGLKTMESQRDFVIPYDIYCPRGGITRVANWRPLKRSKSKYDDKTAWLYFSNKISG